MGLICGIVTFFSSPAVLRKCLACDIFYKIHPHRIYFSKSLSQLFPVNVGWVGVAVVTNDWCIDL